MQKQIIHFTANLKFKYEYKDYSKIFFWCKAMYMDLTPVIYYKKSNVQTECTICKCINMYP